MKKNNKPLPKPLNPNNKAVLHILQENYDSFCLIAYNINDGTRLVLANAKTPRDLDALAKSLEIVGNRLNFELSTEGIEEQD